MADPSTVVPPHTVLETERLRLRTLHVGDAEALLPMLSDPKVMKWTISKPLDNLHQAERWVSARALGADVFNFAVELRNADYEVIGTIGSYHWPSVGYLLRSDHWGQGYATEALRVLIPAIFERMPSPAAQPGDGDNIRQGFDYIEAMTDAENVASQRVLLKSGFARCETLVQGFESPNLGLRDSVVFRIPRPGFTLDQLGLAPGSEHGVKDQDSVFTPPIQ